MKNKEKSSFFNIKNRKILKKFKKKKILKRIISRI